MAGGAGSIYRVSTINPLSHRVTCRAALPVHVAPTPVVWLKLVGQRLILETITSNGNFGENNRGITDAQPPW